MIDRFPHLAQRIFNVPLAIHPAKAEVAITAISDRLGVTEVLRRDGSRVLAFDEDGEFAGPGCDVEAGYEIVEGVAVIPVDGMIVHKSSWLDAFSGLIGCNQLRQSFLAALADPSAKAIVLEMNSPGGETSGVFDLADTIYESRGDKPIWAICNDMAYSAGYALASACDVVTVPQVGGVGSIGVLLLLVDRSKVISSAGLSVHFVHYGEQKAEETRQQLQGVKPEMLERLQADVDLIGDLFVAAVARNRNMSADAVRAQQADCYYGQRGVDAGLADVVAAPHEAFAALLDSIRGPDAPA